MVGHKSIEDSGKSAMGSDSKAIRGSGEAGKKRSPRLNP